MQLPETAVQEFKELMKQQGHELTDAEAREGAATFLRMMRAVYRPIQKKDAKRGSAL